jgi:hypothetical protein
MSERDNRTTLDWVLVGVSSLFPWAGVILLVILFQTLGKQLTAGFWALAAELAIASGLAAWAGIAGYRSTWRLGPWLLAAAVGLLGVDTVLSLPDLFGLIIIPTISTVILLLRGARYGEGPPALRLVTVTMLAGVAGGAAVVVAGAASSA